MMSTVGLCGVGVMGRAAAKKIIESGAQGLAFDVSQASREKASALGVRIVDNPAEVMAGARVVLLFLPGPSEVAACVCGEKGLLSAAETSTVIVDMSTVNPSCTQRMSAEARKSGVGYLDAPVLGRPTAVGKWALPVGGETQDLELARPVLNLLADKIFHIGAGGSGNRLKLLNQLMFGAINAMTAEMTAIAVKSGIDPALLYETITASQAGTVSNLLKELGQRIAQDNYRDPTFTVDLLVKDVRLAIEMAKESDAPPLLAGIVTFINEIAQAQGYGASDTAEMWKCLYRLWERNSDTR
jgi:3-hydroxyisobutyrate dehydrogenase-like beta-hydroxyacid dehydrogenase